MDSQQDVECDQCQTVPETYVKLDCEHKFCLICLAYNYLQIQQERQNIEELEKIAMCSKCNQVTKLDQDTVEAIHMVIKEIIVPLIEQNQKSNNESDVVEVIDELQDLDVQQVASQHQSNQKNNLVNERLQLYLERLDRCFKQKFETIKDIQDQKYQFQQRCKQAKDEINSQYQQYILSLEQKKNQTFNDINSIEMIQLLEIQKQEKDLEQQIQQMAQFQEEIASLIYQNQHKSQEDISKLLLEVEKSLNVPNSSLQIKSSLLTTQRQLLKLSTNAQSHLCQSQPSLIQDFNTQTKSRDLMSRNQNNSDEKQIDSRFNVHFDKQDKLSKFSPIRSEKLNELWPKNDKPEKSQEKEKKITRESRDINDFREQRDKEKEKRGQKILTQESMNANQKQSKFRYEESEQNQNTRKLVDSQISQKNNLLSKWKDQLFDVFDKKQLKSESPKIKEKERTQYIPKEQPFQRESSTHYPRESKHSQEKVSAKQQLINRACNIHDVLNMQYQNFMTQKENLIRR